LRKIPQSLIVERLVKIAESENVQVSKNAIRVIARAADGGMRDALSLMDQLIAFNGDSDKNKISEEQVLTTFGITSQHQRENLLKAILTNDYRNFVLELNAVAQQGKTIEHLFYDIIEYLRGIEITLLVDNPDEILEVGEESIEVYRKLSSFASLEKLQLLLESLSAIGRMLHDSINKHVFIETAIMKAMRYSSSVKVNDIIKKLNELKSLDSSSGSSHLPIQKVVHYSEKISEHHHSEFNTLHSRRIFEEKALLEKCMHRLTGINNLKLNVKLVKGLISPPVMQKTKDLDEVKEKILNNEFVQKTLEIFDGTLVDFRG